MMVNDNVAVIYGAAGAKAREGQFAAFVPASAA
jgi:hypothetical protein